MDIQEIIAAFNEFLRRYSYLKEIQDLKQASALLQREIKDLDWYLTANSFIASMIGKYPPLKYLIDKHRDGRSGTPDIQTMADYLVIAEMCIIAELYVETHKQR